MNKVIIMGRLTRQPEVKHTTSGKPVCKFSIAVDTGYKGKEHTSFFNCTAWNKTAETIAQYFSKGQRILVDGNLKQESWEKDGVKQYSVEITVFSFDFIEPKDKNATEYNNVQPELNTVEVQEKFSDVNPFTDDDIPF